MKLRMLIEGLLLAALFLPISFLPLASSQTTGTSTTMTISQPASQGQCSIVTLAFIAHTGEQITGTFGSDASINFYILSQNDLNAIQNCRLEPSVRPIFIEEKSVGHNNPYRSLSFPANGTYYFVFLFVRGPTQLTKGYATVELSFPSAVVIMGTTGNVSIPTSSTLLSTSPFTSGTSASSMTSTTLSIPTSTMAPTASTTSALTETPSSSSAVFGMPLTSLLLIIGGVIIAGGGVIGLTLFRNRKRRTLSNYLAKIDSTYNEFAVDREECRTQLERLKSSVIEMLNKGRIDEGHFLMLDEKITEYLKDLTQTTAKYKRPPGTDDGTDPENASVAPQPPTQVKYCSNCGAKLSAEDKICKRCGTTQ